MADKIKTTTLTSFDDYNIKETLRVVYGGSSENMKMAYEGMIYNAKEVSADGIIDVKFSVQPQAFVVVTGTAVLFTKINSDGEVPCVPCVPCVSPPALISRRKIPDLL